MTTLRTGREVGSADAYFEGVRDEAPDAELIDGTGAMRVQKLGRSYSKRCRRSSFPFQKREQRLRALGPVRER
jgi:hypothetical protein